MLAGWYGCFALLYGSGLQEEVLFHIQQSEAKDLKAILRALLQQQAGISASSKLSRANKQS